MPELLVKGGDVLYAGQWLMGADLIARAGRIASIGPHPAAADEVLGMESLDASGCYVLPGLIDIHTHGMLDVMVDKDDIHRYSQYQAENGVTACVPTLAGSPAQNIVRMRAILAETHEFRHTPNLVGFRPEIMYLVDASAGPAASLARPELATTEAVWEASCGLIKVWDISPELEGALPFVEWCQAHGVVASMAHSNATIAQVRVAVDAGMSHVTHLYDLFPMPWEVDEGVYPAGVTDYINVEARLTVELIPDGVHAHPLLVEKTLRCKGLDRVVFITDSLKGSGLPPGVYEGLIPGEPVVVTADRGIRRISDDILSGSAITQLAAFRNAVFRFGRSIAQAVQLCSTTPARVLGLARKGCLAPGLDADLVILDRELQLRATVVAGKLMVRNM